MPGHCDECGRLLAKGYGTPDWCPNEWDGFGNGGSHSPALTHQGGNVGKATQARTRESAATRKLKEQREDTTQHIANIDSERAQLQQRDQQLVLLRAEMLGRLRKICEDLGEVDPLPTAVVPELDAQGNGAASEAPA